MKTYPKIETLFDRGPDFTVDTTRLRRPEFGAIDRWIFTEKVDGTNIRVDFRRHEPGAVTTLQVGGRIKMTVGGRTDNAQLPKPLEAKLTAHGINWRAKAEQILDTHGIDSLTLFGEGYGPKIQKGGGNYADEQDFVLFDVIVNDLSWLDEDGITETAETFEVDRVATYVIGSWRDAVTIVRGPEFPSLLAKKNGKPTDFEIEGIVARPLVPLYNGRGQRVMWKLKGSDFRAGKR